MGYLEEMTRRQTIEARHRVGLNAIYKGDKQVLNTCLGRSPRSLATLATLIALHHAAHLSASI